MSLCESFILLKPIVIKKETLVELHRVIVNKQNRDVDVKIWTARAQQKKLNIRTFPPTRHFKHNIVPCYIHFTLTCRKNNH